MRIFIAALCSNGIIYRIAKLFKIEKKYSFKHLTHLQIRQLQR
jgi:hypothetical protein